MKLLRVGKPTIQADVKFAMKFSNHIKTSELFLGILQITGFKRHPCYTLKNCEKSLQSIFVERKYKCFCYIF